MTRRTPLLRFLALLWAGIQLATPAFGSLADARFAAAAGDPVAHVESTTLATCPVIHPPDCAVCRYLSGTASEPETQDAVDVNAARVSAFIAADCAPARRTTVLPDGRAPPAT
jgi:hypothetical protein